jgi:hypothetical protein
MIKITQAFVKKVKAHNKKTWLAASWHTFEALPEVEAVSWALMQDSQNQYGLADIVKDAKKYLSERQ